MLYYSYLKSSLDRFIGNSSLQVIKLNFNLKSSLDRFIVELAAVKFVDFKHLKSSLDRFIEFIIFI